MTVPENPLFRGRRAPMTIAYLRNVMEAELPMFRVSQGSCPAIDHAAGVSMPELLEWQNEPPFSRWREVRGA